MGLIDFFPLVLAKGLANRTARESGFRLGIGTGELRNFKRIAELRVHHDGGRLIGRIFPPRIDLELNLSCGTLSPHAMNLVLFFFFRFGNGSFPVFPACQKKNIGEIWYR